MAAEWLLFKAYYPYADFFTDSYSYIETPRREMLSGTGRLVISVFLRLVHAISISDTAVVTLQYALVARGLSGFVCNAGEAKCDPAAAARIVLAGILLNLPILICAIYITAMRFLLGSP